MAGRANQAPEDGRLFEPGTTIREESYAGKTVVVCVGNRYLRDDGIGIHVADQLVGHDLGEGVIVEACQTADLSLFWQYSGASKVIIVDSVKSGTPPGTVSRYTISPNQKAIASLPGLHSAQLSDMFDVASQTGLLTCPVAIIGIEPKDCGIGEGLSDELASVLPVILLEIIKELSLS